MTKLHFGRAGDLQLGRGRGLDRADVGQRSRHDEWTWPLRCRGGSERVRHLPALTGQPDHASTTHQRLALVVDVFERLVPLALGLQLAVALVQLQGGARVLDRVVRALALDVLAEDDPGEEAEGDLALAGDEVVDVDRVDDLRARDVDVCGGRQRDSPRRAQTD